ncbi:3-hydroxyacyl-CoA dehydrogenase family protein [Dongia rigui]|uniref:3-hydroxyacyl-CoA dehydrogenase family protein n=1 Tax=Dongia rigui TaxID=940149 RepID=A0ABU5E1L6_9PROT|nr:3-hydroxyacyl-CoA dehydrogenase family protein [Dongia rigui]MDY0873494.1 3-hydroxyacyl-CoA dehydrogenase family protein [Dongia rigui]
MGAERIAVIGNGIIGHGVAQVFAAAGHPVQMIGRNQASLDTALGKIKASLAEFVANDLMTSMEATAAIGRIATGTTLDATRDAAMVIEAVTEDLPLKLKIFGELDALCRPETILASSSGQPASALIANVKRPARVIATHFWYPPQLIPLVEICGGPYCAPDVVARTVALVRGTGKEPVVIEKEVKGFIGNRLQFALLREAWALWADGIASAEAIDAVVKASFGRRIDITGPIESADIGGLATMVSFGNSLIPDLSTAPQAPEKVDALLKTDGMPGIYDWQKRDAAALRAKRMTELFRWLKADRAAKDAK